VNAVNEIAPTAINSEALIAASLELRSALAETSRQVDHEAVYPLAGIQLIEASPVGPLSRPTAIGGLAADNPADDIVLTSEIATNIAAGESSTAQIWYWDKHMSSQFLGADSPMGAEAKAAYLARAANEPIRLVGTAAERYKKRFVMEMTARVVDGGIVVDGTKYFGTGVDGAAYVHIPVTLEGREPGSAGSGVEALIDLRSPGVVVNSDWDNMGQRATVSHSVSYHDVFIPDGWWWFTDSEWAGGQLVATTQVGVAAMLVGIGFGALDALVDFLQRRTSYRESLSDPVFHYRVGRYAAALRAAQAGVRDAARFTQDAVGTGAVQDRAEMVPLFSAIDSAKLAAADAAIAIAGDMHGLTGGQSTSNVHGLDRFWRNARSLAAQDVLDIRQIKLGSEILNGVVAPSVPLH
jgi:alkylation response protein AidB-like acyl-CoA dehydrogenase